MPHKLLLADDSITIQRVIELTFADEDVQVLAVGDGKKAIASIQSDRPDIVLADVGMPERDGYEVAEFIKGNPQLANIPVLLLTGAFEPIDETRARAVGCDGVLVKPFEPQMVINRVKDLLAGRRPGGLWGNKTTPSPPSREAPPAAPEEKDASAQSVAAGSGPASSASLEDYFDRLDAAFASVEAATEPHGRAGGGAFGADVRYRLWFLGTGWTRSRGVGPRFDRRSGSARGGATAGRRDAACASTCGGYATRGYADDSFQAGDASAVRAAGRGGGCETRATAGRSDTVRGACASPGGCARAGPCGGAAGSCDRRIADGCDRRIASPRAPGATAAARRAAG